MGQTLSNTENSSSTLLDLKVVKITKLQVIRFFQFVSLMGLFTVDVIAVRIDSPMLKPLLFVQVIAFLIYLAKNSKSNTVLLKK